MGAGVLQPVITQHTQVAKLGIERLPPTRSRPPSNAASSPFRKFARRKNSSGCLPAGRADRRLIFCDEDSSTNNPLPALQAIAEKKLGLLVGPEGGFSEDERRSCARCPLSRPSRSGPRILRADTAAVAALAVIQATIGDW